MLDPVVLSIADCLVQTASTVRRGDYVPQGDAPCRQPLPPGLVIERVQVLPNGATEQLPELIGRMRIVSPRGKRRISRQATEYEEARIGTGDRRQSGFDAQR